MKVFVEYQEAPANEQTLQITGSKSESNRLLILKSIFPNICIQNVSNSDDSSVLIEALTKANGIIDIHHAGTAMRFLTAFFASQTNRIVTLTGSDRMKERPIKALVDALKELGADITYLDKSGYPPIKIVGKRLEAEKVQLRADISSQFISALMLIGPTLENGLHITLNGKITSKPYIEMTSRLLNNLGIKCSIDAQTISVSPAESIHDQTIEVESDWSAASYFYSIVALSENLSLNVKSFKKNSLQGDSALVEIYENLGVETQFTEAKHLIKLRKKRHFKNKKIVLDLNRTPDIAQTIAVTCFGLGISCKLYGLETLKIKETDRLTALKAEIEKLGGKVEITSNSLTLHARRSINKNVDIETYNDHRMAMAFAPLALIIPIYINDPHVVSKSYPEFWKDLKSIGFLADFQE